jgi:hypothetical protein
MLLQCLAPILRGIIYTTTTKKGDNMQQKQVRQGDVLLIPCDERPTGTASEPKGGRVILAEGEATGHHHSVPATVCDLFDGARPVLVVREPATLTHQEHGAIEIAPGTYWVVRQREYTPAAIRRVMD